MKVLNNDEKKYLNEIYFNPLHSGSFEGPKKLFHIVQKEKKHKISFEQIKNWIQNQTSYSTNRRIKRNFQRNRVIVAGIDDQWDADLASFINYSEENKTYQYLLCVIDIFSRYAWVVPLKDKTAERMIQGFERIFRVTQRRPRRIRSDAGSEFTSKEFQVFLKNEGINHFTTHSEKQANYVERFIKTLKNKIYRYMTANNSPKYIDQIQKFVKSYNRTFHSGIQIEPINVSKRNERKIWWEIHWPKESYHEMKSKMKNRKFAFNIKDKVRIAVTRKTFQREYDSKWTNEIFTISKRFFRYHIPVYKLVDLENESIKGTFYQSELQKISNPSRELFHIDKIRKYKGTGKGKKALVHWKGWPKKFDSWVLVSEIKDI